MTFARPTGIRANEQGRVPTLEKKGPAHPVERPPLRLFTLRRNQRPFCQAGLRFFDPENPEEEQFNLTPSRRGEEEIRKLDELGVEKLYLH